MDYIHGPFDLRYGYAGGGQNETWICGVRTLRYGAVCLIAFLLAAGSAIAQPGQNIAGSYRGLMTECLSVVRSTDCRNGLAGLVRLADEVDARRVEWERAAGNPSAAGLQEQYTQAVARLSQAVADFKRDMNPPAAASK